MTWYVYQALAAAGWPSGVLSDTQVGARIPLAPSSESILFRDDRLDLGGRIAVSPAFVEVGPRVTLEPIAVFDLNLQASVLRYVSPRYGVMGFDTVDGTLDPAKQEKWLAGDGFTANGWTLQANPVAQGRVPGLVFFSSWTVSRIHVDRPDGEAFPYVFEPFRGMVIAWDDVTVEHLSAVCWEPLDGEEGPMLRLGGALRGHWSTGLPGNGSLALGGALMAHPGSSRTVPDFTAVVLPYLKDPDRVGRVPFVAVVAEWNVGPEK